jgi:hypothetical protein
MKDLNRLDLSWFKWKPKSSTCLLFFALLPVISGCGHIFASGPPINWESSTDLESIALTQPCTNSKALVAVDGVFGTLYALQGLAYSTQDIEDKGIVVGVSLMMAAADLTGAVAGNKKVNNCKLFNAAVLQQRRGNGSDNFSLLSSDWNEKNATTPWIESFGVSPLPKIP